MAASMKDFGSDVKIQHATGCGNPCHPGDPCTACQPFWKMMLETGRFQAYIPPTFEGPATAHNVNITSRRVEFGDLKIRSRGSNS
jgi:hypothetical protein